MKAPIRTTIAAFAMGALVLTVTASAATFLSVDAAYAKSDKSKGKSSESRGKSGEARGKSGSKGKSAESRKVRGKSSSSVEKFFAKLTGKESAPSKLKRVANAKKTNVDSLHPSELGNMNGALNANINAVLAHIRNGNGNGPVGHIAVLAAASASAEGARRTVARAALFDAIDASEYETLDDYYLALEGMPGNEIDPVIEAAEDKDLAATEAGFDSYDQYRSLLEVPPAQPDEGIDQALAALGLDTENRGDAPADLALDSADPQVIAAKEKLTSELDAENSLLAYWNKNPGGEVDPDTGRTEAETQLLTELRDRFTDEEMAAIQDAAGTATPDMEPEVVMCEQTVELCDDEDEVVLVVK